MNYNAIKKFSIKTRGKLIKGIKERANMLGIEDDEVIEEIAFNLFYRIIAIRFMEVNKYLPLEFEKAPDDMEYLLPDNLKDSIIQDLEESIDEYDWKIELDENEDERGEHGIEIIGWLYQYYISEKKDEVFADLKKNIKITKENIPVATQLFTPKWIVKYMVENSLGRFWLQSHPDEELKSKWKYYLEDVELGEVSQTLSPEDIKFLDPCMGSGNILVYAFDVLYDIYLSEGYLEKEIPRLILENNLYGLDIDDKVVQLARFALMMKARSKSSEIFKEKIKLNLVSIQESNDIPEEFIDYFIKDSKDLKNDIDYLLKVFEKGKEYGSILEVKPIDFDKIEERLEKIKVKIPKFLQLLKQGRIMTQKYDIVCTNPPYIRRRNLNSNLIKYIDKYYKYSKHDMYSVFIEKAIKYSKENGLISLLTPQSWMTLGAFKDFRRKIILDNTIISMAHMGVGAFGADFGTTSFVLRKRECDNYRGTYTKLTSVTDIDEKEKLFLSKQSIYNHRKQKDFKGLPNNAIAYWISDNLMEIFENNELLGEVFITREGLTTGNNDRFLRFWYEVNIDDISFNGNKGKWFPYNKGGGFRKWFGNNQYVINWENDGYEIKNFKDEKTGRIKSHNYNDNYILKRGITWGGFSSRGASFRICHGGFLFDSKGSMGFCKDDYIYYILALLNSKVVEYFLEFLAGTRDTKPGHLKLIPFKIDYDLKDRIDYLTKECIHISKLDWDLYEVSWNFKIHPLLIHKGKVSTIEEAFNSWSYFTNRQFKKLKENEEELNEIFIKIYGLEDELTPEVLEKDVTITKADRERNIKSFISYAVGCMFGRYSLEIDSGEWIVDNIISIPYDITERFIEFVEVTFGAEVLEENINYIAKTLEKTEYETSIQTIQRYFFEDFYKEHVKTYKRRPIYRQIDSAKGDNSKDLIYIY